MQSTMAWAPGTPHLFLHNQFSEGVCMYAGFYFSLRACWMSSAAEKHGDMESLRQRCYKLPPTRKFGTSATVSIQWHQKLFIPVGFLDPALVWSASLVARPA